VLPIFARAGATTSASKLQQYFLAFGPLFVLLSISTEGLFYASFSLTLYLWVEIEAKLHHFTNRLRTPAPQATKKDRGWRAEALSKSLDKEDQDDRPQRSMAPVAASSRRLTGADVRRALFFLFFVQVAFFGAAKYVYFRR
jgi:phosphatidylinositol glycan class N